MTCHDMTCGSLGSDAPTSLSRLHEYAACSWLGLESIRLRLLRAFVFVFYALRLRLLCPSSSSFMLYAIRLCLRLRLSMLMSIRL